MRIDGVRHQPPAEAVLLVKAVTDAQHRYTEAMEYGSGTAALRVLDKATEALFDYITTLEAAVKPDLTAAKGPHGYCNLNVRHWPEHADLHAENDDCMGFRAVDAVNPDDLRRLATELTGVDWAGGSNGQQTIEDAADYLAALAAEVAAMRENATQMDDLTERVAEAIYDAMREHDPVGRNSPWVPRGNSDKQDEARRRARAALAAAAVTQQTAAAVEGGR